MILTTHILAGAAIATKIKNPFIALTLAFFSNYLLDSLPHSEYSLKNMKEHRWQNSAFDFLKVAFDLIFGISIILFFSKNYILSLAGAFFAILPDGFTFLFFVFPNNKLLKKHFDLHESAHIFNNKKTSNFWRITAQILVVLVATFFLAQ
jgi:hypothetical protein